MKIKYFAQLVLIFLFAGITIYPQHKSHYVSDVNNEIKSLSSDEMNELSNGTGMGLAKAAELNHYPGPKHVLDLSSELNLTGRQIEETEKIYESMKAEAVGLGKVIIEKEKDLDKLFVNNIKDEGLIKKEVMDIAELKGQLRFVHLNAHLKQKDILTSEQNKMYDKLRGY